MSGMHPIEPERAQHLLGVSVFHRIRPVSSALDANSSLIDFAVARLWPWTRNSYPGMQKGFLTILSRPMSWQGVRWWRRRSPMPAWAARDIAAVLLDRSRGDAALADLLLAHADAMDRRVHHMSVGFHVRRRVVED